MGLAYYDGPTDGTTGPAYTDAVTAFQADHAITVDGDPGAQTQEALAAVVSHVQRRVGQAQDGYYGPSTEAGVCDFQTRWGGLPTDGRADAATMNALEVPRVVDPEAPAPDPSPNPGFNEPITRAQVIERAMVWVNDPPPYDMGSADVGPENDPAVQWRKDCSGFVSMALNIRHQDNPTGLTTETLHPDGGYGVSHAITKDELKPGDFILQRNRDSASQIGHVVLFDGWADEARTTYRVLEQAYSTGGTAARTIAYPYANLPEYHPFRYNRILG